MPDQAVPISTAYAVRSRRLSVGDAVKAVLSFRASEPRSFGNEDDTEGPRSLAPETVPPVAPPRP